MHSVLPLKLGVTKGHKEVAKSFCPKGQELDDNDKKGSKIPYNDTQSTSWRNLASRAS
jgi:hypothetical protein